MGELIGTLGLVPNAAAAVWLVYGGWKLGTLMRNGRNGRPEEGIVLQFADRLADSRQELKAHTDTGLDRMTERLTNALTMVRRDIQGVTEAVGVLNRDVDRLVRELQRGDRS